VSQPLRITAVLFDLDGTLADSAGDLALALNRIRESRGLAPIPAEDLRPYASSGARGLLHRGMGITQDHPEYGACASCSSQLFRVPRETTTLFDGVSEALDAIEARGLRWGIVTNKFERFAMP
jgi:phosphoglycolate phosphatase